MDVWLGIDGTNWVHALYHALRGQNVLEHVARRVKILADYTRASRVLICFDRRSFRHDLYAGYKANRAAQPESLRQLLAEALQAIATDAGQVVYQDGYEADDCLATLAEVAVASGRKCVLASPDKDLWQCLRDGRVSVLRRFGTHGAEVLDPEWQTERELAIAEKTKDLRPSNWADFQALVGERGDNVAGCPGWGVAVSRRGLANAGSIEAMLRDPWEVKCTRKQLTTLQNWAKASSGWPSIRQCVTLRTDVPAIIDAVR